MVLKQNFVLTPQSKWHTVWAGYELQIKKGLSTTLENYYMNAKQTVQLYENIWNNRFLRLF